MDYLHLYLTMICFEVHGISNQCPKAFLYSEDVCFWVLMINMYALKMSWRCCVMCVTTQWLTDPKIFFVVVFCHLTKWQIWFEIEIYWLNFQFCFYFFSLESLWRFGNMCFTSSVFILPWCKSYVGKWFQSRSSEKALMLF